MKIKDTFDKGRSKQGGICSVCLEPYTDYWTHFRNYHKPAEVDDSDREITKKEDHEDKYGGWIHHPDD